MPITQTRMIALINAANDYRQAFDTLCDHIASRQSSINSGQSTPEASWQYISSIALPRILLHRPAATTSTISVEHYHFSHNLRRNQRAAAKASQKRQSHGSPQRAPNQVPFATTDLYGFNSVIPTPQMLRDSTKPALSGWHLDPDSRLEIDQQVEQQAVRQAAQQAIGQAAEWSEADSELERQKALEEQAQMDSIFSEPPEDFPAEDSLAEDFPAEDNTTPNCPIPSPNNPKST